MSKLIIVDLTNEVEFSSAAMSAIGGGMSCQAGQAVADTWASVGTILSILGDNNGSTIAFARAGGVLEGACGA
jgi:hypothetical protein